MQKFILHQRKLSNALTFLKKTLIWLKHGKKENKALQCMV